MRIFVMACILLGTTLSIVLGDPFVLGIMKHFAALIFLLLGVQFCFEGYIVKIYKPDSSGKEDVRFEMVGGFEIGILIAILLALL